MDGFGAAWAVHQKLGEDDRVHYVPVTYGDPVPDMPDLSEVYIVDFSFPRRELLELDDRMRSVTVLDHHETAQDDLLGIPFATFNMNHSGAVLTWKHFHPGQAVPTLLQYIEDRDLWNWELPESAELNATIATYPKTFDNYNILATSLQTLDGLAEAAKQGEAILRAQAIEVESTCHSAIMQDVGGVKVPTVNATSYVSEIGSRLLEKFPDAPFSASYRILPDSKGESLKMVWSLRSHKGGFHVGNLAKKLGGGGHQSAAGFRSTV